MADEVKKTLEEEDLKKSLDAQAKEKRVQELEASIARAEKDLKTYISENNEALYSLPPESRAEFRSKMNAEIKNKEKEIQLLKELHKTAKAEANDAVKAVGDNEQEASRR